MARGESAFDGPLAPGTIEGSQITGNGVATFNVSVMSGAENSTDEPAFAALGSGGRPLAPDDDGKAESISARTADGLPIVAMRDLRIEKARTSPPAEGTVYKAGYHGAELRFDVPSEGVSTATLRDSTGSELVLDGDGVRVPDVAFVQGDKALAQDLLLAQPAIDLLAEMGPIVLALIGAVNTLAPGTILPTQITNLTTKLGPYLAPGSPSAPTTRAPNVRGQPGA